MAQAEENEQAFPSTTWTYKRVKISRPPEATRAARRSRSFRALPPWPWRKPIVVKLSYRGGPECWWELHARGSVIRRPGSVALHDIMREVCNQP